MVLLEGSPGFATYGGIFRGSIGKFIDDFYAFLDVHIALVVEFYEVIRAIEQAQKMSFTNLWFECDFALVCVAFTDMTNVP